MKSCLDFVKNLVVGLTLSLNKRPRDLSVHKRNPRPIVSNTSNHFFERIC